MKRDKPFRTISELIALLKSRELHIEDENLARRFLHQINYYRFSVMINSLKGSHSNIFGS